MKTPWEIVKEIEANELAVAKRIAHTKKREAAFEKLARAAREDVTVAQERVDRLDDLAERMGRRLSHLEWQAGELKSARHSLVDLATSLDNDRDNRAARRNRADGKKRPAGLRA